MSSTQIAIAVRPLSDRVILKRDDAESMSEGGIVIPDCAKETPARGTVIAVGPGKRTESGEAAALAVSPGDRVLFAKYAGNEIECDGESYLMLREDDIMAIIGEE